MHTDLQHIIKLTKVGQRPEIAYIKVQEPGGPEGVLIVTYYGNFCDFLGRGTPLESCTNTMVRLKDCDFGLNFLTETNLCQPRIKNRPMTQTYKL